MADVNANIGVQIDTSDALAQLKSLQRQLSQFHTSVAKSSATAAAAQKSLQKNLIGSINSIGAFSAELRTVKTSAESFTNSLEKNKFSMREYFRYAGASTKTFGRLFTSELDTISKVAEDRVKKLQTQYIKLGRDSQGAMKAIAIMPNQLDFSKTSTQLQIAAQKQAIFNQLLKQGSTNLLNFGKNTQWAGRQLMVGFTIPLGILGMKASQTFMDMEKAALKFKKVYGDLLTSPEETKAALDGITELGKQYTKYGVAVADTVALSAEAAAAGFQGLDLQRQTAQATRLSVLGQIEAQQALETTIALQNAFKMSSEDLAGSIDFLNAVENQTVTSLDDITIAIPKVAPVIQQLGGDVKDLAFFLTAMKEGGINASEGANALKSGLAAIINPTTKAKAMLEGLGINITKIVESNKGDIKSTVVDFAKALDTLDPLTRARAIEQLFGKFQFARLSTLFQNVTKDGTQASRVLDLAGSSIEDLASLANKELGMSAASPMNQFKKAVEDLKLALVPVGEVFLKTVTPILEFFGNLLSKFSGLSDTTKKVITIITVALAGVGPVLLMTFGLLANGVANIIKLFATLRNGYLRLTGQSTVLGEQTQYMTMEQLEASAAAHSLNQSHATLKQTFDVEKASLDQLIASYQSATRASAAFAAANPGAMLPIPGGKRPKKFAKGKPYVVGGSGNKDSEPAMLAPGETVIPAAMSKKYGGLINGMIAGNIPGYRKGRGGEGDFAHITSRQVTTIGDILDELEALPEAMKKSRRGLIDGMRDLVDTLGRGKTAYKYSGLGFTQAKNLNIGMADGGAVSTEEFLSDFSSRGISKFEDSMGYAGVAMDEVADDLRTYDANLERLTRDFAKKNKTITSTDFESIEKEARMLVPAQSKLRKALDDAASTVTEYRYNISQKDLAAKGIEPYSVASKKDPTKVSKKKKFKTKGGRSVRTGGDHVFINVPGAFNPGQVEALAIRDAKVYTDTIKKTTQDPYMASRDRNSPHPQTIQDGQDDGKSYSTNFQNSVKNSSQSAQAAASRQALYGTGPINATTKSIRRQEEAKARRALVSSEVPTTTPGIGSRLKSVGGKIAGKFGGGRGIGISSGVMMASQFLPGKAGQIAGQASGAAFAIQALGMLPGPLKLVAGGALAVTAGLKLMNKIQESNRQKMEAFGDAVKTTTEQTEFLGKKFGFVPTKNALQRFDNSKIVSATQRTELESIKSDPEFKKSYGKAISGISKLGDKEAASALKFRSADLLSQGMPAETVANIMTAIQEEAGKSDLNIDFKAIKFDEKGLDSLASEVNVMSKKAGQKINKAFSQYEGMFEDKVGAARSDVFTDDAVMQKYGKEVKQVAESVASFSNTLANLAANGKISGDQLKKSISTMFTALGKNVKSTSGQMLIFRTAMTSINKKLGESVSGITKTADAQAILAAATAGVSQKYILAAIAAMTYSDALDAVAAERKSKGLVADETAAAAATRGFARGAAADARLELERLAKEALKTQELLNKIMTPKTGKGGGGTTDPKWTLAGQLKNDITALENQNTSFKKLVDAGISAADALELVSNEQIAAALATKDGLTPAIKDQIKKFLELKKGAEDLADSLAPYGEKVKSVFAKQEAMFNLQEEIIKSRFADSIYKDTEALRNQEYALELVNRKIKEQEELMASLVDPKQKRIDDISYQLEGISFREDEINEKYDKQSKLLSTITKMNQDLFSIQKKRASLADALSSGDISSAASIIMEMRAEQAGIQATSQQEVLDAAREQELSALGRVALEKESKRLQYEILTIQRNQSKEYEDQAKAIQKIIDGLRNNLSDYQEKAADAIYDMSEKLSASFGRTKGQIQSAMSMIDLANAAGFDINSETLITNILNDALDTAEQIKKIMAEVAGLKIPTTTPTTNESTTLRDKIESQFPDSTASDNEINRERGNQYGSNNPGVTTTPTGPSPSQYISSDLAAAINAEKAKAAAVKAVEQKAVIAKVEKIDAALQPKVSAAVVTKSIADIVKEANKVSAAVINKEKPSSVSTPAGIANKLKAIGFMSSGGMVPRYFAKGGFNRGTDTVPAMLTPGEFVVNKRAAAGLGIDNLNAMNNGQLSSGSVYNYKVDVTLNGSDMNPNDVANAVLTRIKQLESRNVRRQGI